MLVLMLPRISSRVSGFPVALPCLWGNLSFSKVSKQVVISFFFAGTALGDIQTCFITCRKSFCVAGAKFLRRFHKVSCNELHFSWQGQHFGDLCRHFAWQAQHFRRVALRALHSTLYIPHFTLHALHSTLYTLHSTLHTSRFTLHTLHSTLYTLHYTLYTPHDALDTLHSTLYTLHSTL